MVNSRILPKVINYAEHKNIESEDEELTAQPWLVNINDEDVIIVLGNERFTFMKQNVIFFPIYLIKNGRADMQIGVYEIDAFKIPNLTDNDGDINIDLLDDPLIYNFVTRDMLYTDEEEITKYIKEVEELDRDDTEPGENMDEDEDEDENDDEDTDAGEDTDEDSDPDEPDDSDMEENDESDTPVIAELDTEKSKTVIVDENFQPPPSLSEQTEGEAKLEREKVVGKSKPWVAKFMGNQNYEIEEVGSGGDCLFHVIRAALARAGKKTSVKKLRSAVAKEANHETFEQYKNIFDGIKHSLKQSKTISKDLINQNKQLKKHLTTVKDRNEQIKIIDKSKEIKAMYNKEKNDLKTTKAMYAEYEFMEGITNLAQFKTVIKTCRFWGETWALSTLERVLNIKLILLSKENYDYGDIANVVQCGQLNDTELVDQGTFTPDHYIIANYLGYHYQLIKYKDRSIFNFSELPYDLKRKIADKCMERNAGPYSIIPEFKHFQENLDGRQPAPEDAELDDNLGENLDEEHDIERKTVANKEGVIDEEPQETLFNDDVIFQFYSNSSGRPLPGKGSGEKIPDNRRSDFIELAGIPNWRRKLSTFATGTFECDGKEWNSVEHYYQANKFINSNDTNGFYDQFSLDSGTELSQNPILAKAAASKKGKYKARQIRPSDVAIDMASTNERRKQSREQAMKCKFSQIPEYKELLIATRDAKLVQFVRAHPPIVLRDLMTVRQELLRENKKPESPAITISETLI